MCGFIGAFNTDLSRREISNALDVIEYRGPDHRQVEKVGNFILGSCRLAILPPLDSSPICFPSTHQVLSLNGELFDLGRDTENLNTSVITDTEHLGLLLTKHGSSILSSLNGLFAFCWFDGNKLLLARDRFGIKPLYYANYGNGFVFASEMKAILSIPGFSRDLDNDVMSSCFVLGHNIFSSKTPFKTIRAVLPGHSVEVNSSGAQKEIPFAKVPDVPQLGQGNRPDAEELQILVEKMLVSSVKRSLLHDQNPKALFFSGGIDSSLLLDIAREETPITAFVLSDNENADDLLEARKIAAALGVRLHEKMINEFDLSREIVHYMWHFEHPIAGGAFDLLGGVAFHALARHIGNDFRVALCGEGADEVFLGYHRFHMKPSLFIETVRENAINHATPALREWLETHIFLSSEHGANHAIRNLVLHQGLSDYHLTSVDRSGMAFGLEIRPPYLDNALVEYAAGLEETSLIDRTGYWTKIPLRSIAKRRFISPETKRIAVRRKRAMPSAVEIAAARLLEKLPNDESGQTKPQRFQALLTKLFYYLHVDPGLSSPPDFSIIEFAAEFS